MNDKNNNDVVVKTFSRVANPIEMSQVNSLRQMFLENRKSEHYHDIQYINGHCGRSAMLIDPINGNPMVFQFPNLLTTFEAVRINSGTDHLRARIQAQLFYEGIVDRIVKDDEISQKALSSPLFQRQKAG